MHPWHDNIVLILITPYHDSDMHVDITCNLYSVICHIKDLPRKTLTTKLNLITMNIFR